MPVLDLLPQHLWVIVLTDAAGDLGELVYFWCQQGRGAILEVDDGKATFNLAASNLGTDGIYVESLSLILADVIVYESFLSRNLEQFGQLQLPNAFNVYWPSLTTLPTRYQLVRLMVAVWIDRPYVLYFWELESLPLPWSPYQHRIRIELLPPFHVIRKHLEGLLEDELAGPEEPEVVVIVEGCEVITPGFCVGLEYRLLVLCQSLSLRRSKRRQVSVHHFGHHHLIYN